MSNNHVHRIDKFNVPISARPVFLERVRETHALLRTLPGFAGDAIFEQISGPGEINFITFASWESDEAFAAAAGETVTARYREEGFNPVELFAKLGMKADLANYRRLDL
jgi:heme-degrading monooxygenase HmoA